MTFDVQHILYENLEILWQRKKDLVIIEWTSFVIDPSELQPNCCRIFKPFIYISSGITWNWFWLFHTLANTENVNDAHVIHSRICKRLHRKWGNNPLSSHSYVVQTELTSIRSYPEWIFHVTSFISHFNYFPFLFKLSFCGHTEIYP